MTRLCALAAWVTALLAPLIAQPAMANTGPAQAPDVETRWQQLERALAIEVEAEGYPSISFGIVHDGRLVHTGSLGLADQEGGVPATPRTLYAIGSVTKLFTASLMVSLRDRGVIGLDEPVAKHLPRTVLLPTDPRGAPQITFRHLATHGSGLPRSPLNLPRHDDNPYRGYDRVAFHAGLTETPLLYPIGRFYNYSNLGYALLGRALEGATGNSYETLLWRHLLEPLGMKDTVLNPSHAHSERVAVGYSMRYSERPEPDWDMGPLAAAGGLYSTVEDLARFLAMHMRAGQVNGSPVAPGSLVEMQLPQREILRWEQAVGFGWHLRAIPQAGDIAWHSGALGGFSSYVGFSPHHDVGVIVLTNRFRSVERYAEWLLRRSVELYSPRFAAREQRSGRLP